MCDLSQLFQVFLVALAVLPTQAVCVRRIHGARMVNAGASKAVK
jgi:hypothetical protein